MGIFSWLPRNKSKNKQTITKKSDRKVLVISGGGFRGTYALGVMKALEEFGIREEIDAIYGVSIGAVVGSLWASGMNAEKILDLLLNLSIKDFYGKDMLKLSGGFISNKKILKMIEEYLPSSFDDLKIPLYAGCVDTNKARYHLFNSGDLHKIVLGSMSIPGIFPPVKYDEYCLVDGGVLNNFPVHYAKTEYPDHEIIGIALNKFQTDQKIKSLFDNLTVSFEVIMRAKLIENTKLADYLFYRELPNSVLSFNKKQMQQSFDLGYQDGIETFGKKINSKS